VAAAPKLEEERKEVGDWRVEDCDDEEREVFILEVFWGVCRRRVADFCATRER
jgi:hypothetical protein